MAAYYKILKVSEMAGQPRADQLSNDYFSVYYGY